MMHENLLSIQQYAIKNKLSTFAVIKLVNAGKLKTLKKEKDGSEQDFIIDESTPVQNVSVQEAQRKSEEHQTCVDYEVEFHKLLAKYIELQEKYTHLMEKKHYATK